MIYSVFRIFKAFSKYEVVISTSQVKYMYNAIVGHLLPPFLPFRTGDNYILKVDSTFEIQ
jgi:glycerol-3-phosphate acyltransferase PlsY